MRNPEVSERKIIWLFCLLAAIHVFIFSAAFPFFNNVDEQLHLDLAVQYSHGKIPRTFNIPEQDVLQFIAVYGTVEYLWSPEMLPGKRIPPPAWTLPINQVARRLLMAEAIWKEKVKNTEASQPPLYYTFAGAWWKFGKILGLDGGHLLYWLHFMNILILVALIWLGHFAARLIFPENLFLRCGVPALIAFIPQTAFYAIQNDVLSPICFGAAFIYLIKFWRAENISISLAVKTGLALAAVFLTKISNLPLLAASGIFIALKFLSLIKAKNLRQTLPGITAFAICAGLPMALWAAWCKYHFGDFTGSGEKIQILGWTHKPFAEWFHHPIFTPHGFWVFLSGNLETLWQGEILWHRKPLTLPAVDLFYAIASIILILVAFLNLLPKSKNADPSQRNALWFAFAIVTAALIFFGFLSIVYDFHECFYPSQAHPYFTSGRLMLGTLIPFLLLFVFGLDCLLKKSSNVAKFSILACLILFMLASEIATDWVMFGNDFNWFHM